MPWSLLASPRKWQEIALERWSAQHRGVASVVTGGGKTYFAFLCMIHFVSRYPDGRFLILVPSAVLLDQWYAGLADDLGVPEADIALYSSTHERMTPKRVNVAILNTARSLSARIARDSDCCLIVDECHRAGTTQNALALRGEYRATLGLSATPVREYDRGFEELVAPILGPIVYEYDYATARRDGVVAPFRLVNVRVPLLPHERTEYVKLTRTLAQLFKQRQTGHPVDDKIEATVRRRAAVAATAAMRVPVAVRLARQHIGARLLVFHERISDAARLAKLMADSGLRTALYHSKLADPVRRDNLRLFRRGVFDCLVTCRAVDEGVDIPEASVAIIASSTRSRRQRIQRLGRVLRPVVGKQESVIYTLYATLPEQRLLVREANELDDAAEIRWLSTKE
jgi:superfamily II DNA or RNA helicase